MEIPDQRVVSVKLVCTACHQTHDYELHSPVFARPPMLEESGLAWPEGWDGFFTPTVVTCEACGAVDSYKLDFMTMAVRQLLGSGGLQPGVPVLSGGYVPRRASDALEHLRGRAEAKPLEGEGWRRLGNFCRLGGMLDDAVRYWQRALQDDKEIEAVYCLAMIASDRGEGPASSQYAEEALRRYPDPTRQGPARLTEAQVEDLVSVLQTHRPPGRSLLATWLLDDDARQPLCAASSARLDRIRDWGSLAQFLIEERPLSIGFSEDTLPRDSPPSQLELWIDDPDAYNQLPLPSPGPTGSSAAERRAKKQKRKQARKSRKRNRR